MAQSTPRLRILSVGGNAVSAFLSWRLQATNACDVTLVWKSGYEGVAQYGISIKSLTLGNERFKPHAVVRTPEEAAQASRVPFDYVLLCVKALPDVYDLAAVVESVVTPQHTCIILNTTNSLGIEEYLEERFATNVVLSLVCGADLAQSGPAEFDHKGQSTDIWVGWANKNPAIPSSIQKDMAEALAMTLCTAQVSCLVSLNIRQQQMEKMIGPIAFHPASVLFNNPNLSQLYEMPGVAAVISGIIDELLAIANAYDCVFDDDFREKVIAQMRIPAPNEVVGSVMYQDYQARRPMEIETFLVSPIRLAKNVDIAVPRLEVLYALLHDKNQKSLKGEAPPSPNHQQLPPRTSSFAGPGPGPGMRPVPNGMKNGRMPGGRAPSLTGLPSGMPGMRRPPNGHPPRMQNGVTNGYGNGVPYSRRGSMEGNDLEEFSHVMLYDNPDGNGSFQDGSSGSYGEVTGALGPAASSTDLVMRERELAIRQREIELREREQHLSMRRGPPPPRQRQVRRPPPGAVFDDDDDENDYFDPMGGAPRGHVPSAVDENFDMLSITSRRNRKTSNNSHQPAPSQRSRNIFNRNPKNRSSARTMNELPSPHESLMNNALLGYSSNRYGTVDRSALEAESRHNSMTTSRVDDLTRGAAYGAYPAMRRASQSPGNPLQSPTGTGPRTSPPNGYTNGAPNGMSNGTSNGMTNGMRNGVSNGGPSPPGMRQPVPRHPPGHGNSVAPQQVEQHAGVSNPYPLKQRPQVRSLTGSASTSVKTGDSASTNIGSKNTTSSSISSSLRTRTRGDNRA